MPSSGSYATTTLSDAVAALLQRLDDSGGMRWTVAEARRYLVLALQTWASLTGRYRAQGVFTATAAAPFYDLPTVLPTLRAQTTTDLDALTTIEYMLLEPPTPTVWTGSNQYVLADLLGALQRRRDQFLTETASVLTRQQLTIAPPPDGRIPLPEYISAVRRAAWSLVNGTGTITSTTPLLRDDVWGFNNYRTSWPQQTGRPPRAYSIAEPPPLIMQVVDPPLDTGVLDLCTVNTGAVLGTDSTNGTPLGIPNDWVWVVIFGALADLLSKDGLALDPARADYCEQRWRQGIDLAAKASVAWAARIGNQIVPVRSVSDADVYARTWQTGTGVPTQVLTLGQTLVALAPVPATSAYAVTLDVVRNFPIPTTLGSYLQIDQADLDVVLDYAQHLALFKEGAAQLTATQTLLDRFLRMAGVTTTLDSATAPHRGQLQQQTLQDQRTTPRSAPAVPQTLTGTV